MTAMYSFAGTRTDHLGRVIGVDGKPVDTAKLQQDTRAIAQQQATDRLKEIQDMWRVGFDQRQQEAETNASRAFGYRQKESERDFGQRTAFSRQDFEQQTALGRQGFEQNRTLQGDSLSSAERREAAQIASRERMQESGFSQERDMASLRSNLKQREKSEDRTAAIAAFRNRR